MRVLICGGRNFHDIALFADAMARLVDTHPPISVVIHGAAAGADELAAYWARKQGITTTPFPADWDRFGRGAGPIRNQRMLDEGKPELVVAFPGGGGTADMVRRAKLAGVHVIEVPSRNTIQGTRP